MNYNKPEVVVAKAVEVIMSQDKFSNVHIDSSEPGRPRDLTMNAYESDE